MKVLTIIFTINAICGIVQFQCIPKYAIAFKTKIVPNEFIVHFHSKYFSSVRESFIEARLGSNITIWKIVRRENLFWQYPSDFDILRIFNHALTDEIILKIQSHPSVKAVVPQRSVRRIMAYDPNSNLTNINRHTKGVLRNTNPNNDRSRQVCTVLHANVLWKLGITGKGVKVAIFDTGLTKNHPHFRNVKERTNWTNEKSLDDRVSHGTFVAGVIASSRECLGFAPDADLYIFKVFTNSQSILHDCYMPCTSTGRRSKYFDNKKGGLLRYPKLRIPLQTRCLKTV